MAWTISRSRLLIKVDDEDDDGEIEWVTGIGWWQSFVTNCVFYDRQRGGGGGVFEGGLAFG